jgi:hypothetical protein
MKIKIWILGIIISLIVFSGLKIYFNVAGKVNDYKDVISSKNESLKYYKGKNNQLVANQKTLQVTNKNLKKIADDVIDDNDALKSQIKGLKNLNSYLKGQLTIAGEGSTTIHETTYITNTDTIYAKTFNYKNDYLDFSGTIHKSKLDFSYTYRTDFQYVTYWKRPGFLKQKELVMDFSLNDPNAMLTSAQTINIKPDPKKFYETQWFSGLIGIGVGILVFK